MPATVLTGRLLIAAPQLFDPNFDRSIVYLLDHGDGGALGVILNRPTDIEVSTALPSWGALASRTEPSVVYTGGPVSPESAIGVARAVSSVEVDGWSPLRGGLGTVDLGRPPQDIATELEGVRIFAGYSGWAAGQLEVELAADAWIVADAVPGDAFTPQPERLWRSVLRRQGGEVAWLATYPRDPSAN